MDTVIVYEPERTDITNLRRNCERHGITLVVCNGAAEVRDAFGSTAILAVIVPLPANGTAKASMVRDLIHEIVAPEDADILMVYSAPGDTPDGWREPAPPHYIQRLDVTSSIATCFHDPDWSAAMSRITNHRRGWPYPPL